MLTSRLSVNHPAFLRVNVILQELVKPGRVPKPLCRSVRMLLSFGSKPVWTNFWIHDCAKNLFSSWKTHHMHGVVLDKKKRHCVEPPVRIFSSVLKHLAEVSESAPFKAFTVSPGIVATQNLGKLNRKYLPKVNH